MIQTTRLHYSTHNTSDKGMQKEVPSQLTQLKNTERRLTTSCLISLVKDLIPNILPILLLYIFYDFFIYFFFKVLIKETRRKSAYVLLGTFKVQIHIAGQNSGSKLLVLHLIPGNIVFVSGMYSMYHICKCSLHHFLSPCYKSSPIRKVFIKQTMQQPYCMSLFGHRTPGCP